MSVAVETKSFAGVSPFARLKLFDEIPSVLLMVEQGGVHPIRKKVVCLFDPIHFAWETEDLKGRVIADVGAGSAVDIAIKAMLKKHGLETPRDYTAIEAGFPNMEALLGEKKADLVAAVAPFNNSPGFVNIARPLFTAVEALGGATQFVIWTAHDEFIKKNRAVLIDLFEDAIRATRYLTDPANHDAVVAIASKLTKQPPERLQWVFSKNDLYRDPNMLPDPVGLQRAVDAQEEVGFLKAKIDVKPYFDLSLVKEAAARIK